MYRFLPLALIACIALAEAPAVVDGCGVIRRKAGKSEIVITTTNRLAGAIDSLTWGGKEFIDSADHGRQLQSAASFNCGLPSPFWAERFNPTEAGSRDDGAGKTSTSRLLKFDADGGELRTTTRAAFWLAPGEKSSGRPAINTTKLSKHIISKRVGIGYGKFDHVIEYDATFTVPKGEGHTFAQFEAVTGYMPPQFSKFWSFDPVAGKLQPLSEGPGEQALPVILATETGSHAMGVFSPDQPSAGFKGAGYGRFRFVPEKVVKWNCVFRVRAAKGEVAGDYSYKVFVAVGSLDDVTAALKGVADEFRR